MSNFLETLQERVIIFDGAMGTSIHAADVPIEDFEGQEGNPEILNFTRPDVIQAVHAGFLDVGCEVIETNTFGANIVSQGEYGQADKTYDLNVTAAKLAKEVASSYSDRPRWVFGSIGPGTKLPTLGQIDYDTIADGYAIQSSGLIEGGADGLIIETCFDLLQVKAAIAGAVKAFEQSSTKLPLIVQVTMQPEGTMLLGSEIGAALASIDPFKVVDVIGINCSTGPVEMTEHVRHLCSHSRRPVSVQPNMGIPDVIEGKEHFPLSPEEFVKHHQVFVEEFGASIVGGCCGSTPEHLRQLVEALRDHPAEQRDVRFEPGSASLYIAQPFDQETSFFVIGERLNTQGSRKFKKLVEDQDFEGIVEMAKEQIREGCHALDVMPDITGRDGADDIGAIVDRLASQSTLPLFIDSTEWHVMESALKRIGGRPVINSVNLEEGAGPDSSFAKKMRLAVQFGAAVVAGAIEEKGQATTADWKLEVCKKMYDEILSYGLEAHDILWDPLVLPISTGQEEVRTYARETLDAIERLKEELPGTYTMGGISNISFGLSPVSRKVLNSVFLHEAVRRGLDSAIVHYGKILPMARIPDEQKEVALDLIYDRRKQGYDPLTAFMALFEGAEAEVAEEKEELSSLPIEERLSRRIIDGNRTGLHEDLDEARGSYDPLAIINDYLLAGMKVVGELFASGEMQLPFVLQSAETMKAAVAHLEPHMEKVGDGGKGKIVLATVKGDVHDIGKNLVDIILTNNGYTVFNLGIRQPISNIIEAAEREGADAIGLSGLLVKSTMIMREDLEELNRRGLHQYPILLGGAALSRSYVEDDLRTLYNGNVFYGRDAFEGLKTMDDLMAAKRGDAPALDAAPKAKRQRAQKHTPVDVPKRSDVATDVPIPKPSFYGSRIVKGIALPEIARYLNKEVALFRGQWQYKRKKGQSAEEYRQYLESDVEPILRTWLDRSIEEQILQPSVAYGFFPVQSEGDHLIVYREDAEREWVRFTFPRQNAGRFLCISDFFRPKESGEMDVVAFHLVTMGERVSEVTNELFEANRYTDYLHLHGLSVEMAEALAEMWHKRIREELGIAGDDASTVKGLFKQGYRGSRYSFGYPACPNLEDQVQIMELLDPSRIGVTLSEEFQLQPEQSTSAIITHHPEARYFSVAREESAGS